MQRTRISSLGKENGLYFEGTPEVEVGIAPKVGKDVVAQLEIDLGDELDAVKQCTAPSTVCEDAGDNGSRSYSRKW